MTTIDLFLEIMKNEEPNNTHPMPVAESWDGAEWTVDLQMRTRDYDIDGTGVHTELAKARNKALQRIRRTKTMVRKHGRVGN